MYFDHCSNEELAELHEQYARRGALDKLSKVEMEQEVRRLKELYPPKVGGAK